LDYYRDETLTLETNLYIDKNHSTSFIGGFCEIDAPPWICSEPHPSLKAGENTDEKRYLLKNAMEA
jgi:hypothetical protein